MTLTQKQQMLTEVHPSQTGLLQKAQVSQTDFVSMSRKVEEHLVSTCRCSAVLPSAAAELPRSYDLDARAELLLVLGKAPAKGLSEKGPELRLNAKSSK